MWNNPIEKLEYAICIAQSNDQSDATNASLTPANPPQEAVFVSNIRKGLPLAWAILVELI